MKKLNKDNISGIIGTVVFHAGILLLLLFFGFTTPLPLPEETGNILVNFGYDEKGLGDVEPAEASANNTNASKNVPDNNDDVKTPSNSTDEAITTQDFDKDAPEVKTSKTPKANIPKKTTTPQPVVDKRALYPSTSRGKNDNSNSQNQGITNGTGNMGNPNGVPGVPNYSSGGGDGFGWDLEGSGRKMTVNPPKIEDDSQDEGKVVVAIKVDKTGKVISAVPGAKGSTTTKSHLLKKAQDAAYRTQFNANPKALEVQKGKITFTFVVR